MAHKHMIAIALSFAPLVTAETQLMQMSVHGSDGCRTSVAGEECYEKVLWAMQTGVVEHPEWYRNLKKDSSFEDFQLHLHSSTRLSSVCPRPCFAPEAAKLWAETEDFTYDGTPMTPHPTMEPGVPCVCNTTCGNFPYYDIDGDGCLSPVEVERVDSMAGRFEELDVDGNGCVDQDECDDPPKPPPVPVPTPCGCGDYVADGTSMCQECHGSARRRRSHDCDACPDDMFAVPDCDDCMENDAMYLNESANVGANTIYVNKDTNVNGDVVTVGDSITIAKCCCEGPSDHGTFQITAAPSQGEAPYVDEDSPGIPYVITDLTMDFSRFDRVTRTCTETDGTRYSAFYPCGCGSQVCPEKTVCDIAADGGCGGCIPSVPPTPAPTVSARGDPHLVNLNGEHFDVNHGGEFTMLRIPQNTAKTADLELKATILPEHGKPCTTYITAVEVSGTWLGKKVVQVRSYLRSHAKNETDKFLGIRVLRPTGESFWERLDNASLHYIISEPQVKDGFGVTVSTSTWYTTKDASKDAPTVAGQVEIQVNNARLSEDPTKFVIRQDLPRQEHLNLAVRRLSSLGRADVGGLLGFDAHPESLEDVTPECQRHRDGLDQERGPRFAKPNWKIRWEKIKERREQARHGEEMNDNEAAASLANRDMMCVCPYETSTGLGENVYVEGLIGRGDVDGVLVEFQTGRLAEATWD